MMGWRWWGRGGSGRCVCGEGGKGGREGRFLLRLWGGEMVREEMGWCG